MSNRTGTSFARADRLAELFAPAIVDIFAGCGGWSIGEEEAFVEAGYRDLYIDLMVNHWDVAVGVHLANHPMTVHLRANVLEVDPNSVVLGRDILHLHASPDCTDHSKAKGGKPRRKEIRALADVVIVWAKKRRPWIITLENVEEFAQWGPLLKNGQPDKRKRGREFQRWKRELQALGYVVEHRELRACDYDTPTTRKRLYVIATLPPFPIVWPERSHASAVEIADAKRRVRLERMGLEPETLSELTRTASLRPYRTAAECIDWDTPMLSIFASRPEARRWAKAINVGRAKHERVGVPQRPLKLNTQKRLAGGTWKWALNHANPFLVNIQNSKWGPDNFAIDNPMPTVTANPKGGAFAVADVEIAAFAGTLNHGGHDYRTNDLRAPMGTIVSANEARGLVGVAFTAGVGGRAAQSASTSVSSPVPTVTGKADRVVGVAELVPFTVPRYGEREGQEPRSGSIEQPLPTITGTGNQGMLAGVSIVKNCGGPNGHITYGQPADQSLDTITAKCRHGMMAVHLSQENFTDPGAELDAPLRTVTGVVKNGLIAAHLIKFRGDSTGHSLNDPMPTITSGAGAARDAGAAHALGVGAVFVSHLCTSNSNGGQGDPRKPHKTITSGGHSNVAVVCLSPAYSSGSGMTGHTPADPLPTITSKDRFQLAAIETTRYFVLTEKALKRAKRVAVWARRFIGKKVDKFLLTVQDESGKAFKLLTCFVRGAIHLVTDILMRMLKPRELARAQGFDDSYIIDRLADGTRISKADQVKLIGNSVCKNVAKAIVKANIIDSGMLDRFFGRSKQRAVTPIPEAVPA